MIFTDVRQFISGFDISGDLNAINVQSAHIGVETSRFTDSATRTSRGQEQVSISGTGLHLNTSNGAAVRLHDVTVQDEPYTCLPFGQSVGNTALFVPTLTLFTYTLGLTVNDKAPFTVSGNSAGTPLVQKGLLLAIGEKTSNGNSAVIQVGAVPAGKKLYVNFHVIDIDADEVVLTLERDSVMTFDDDPVEVANASFSAVGGESGVSADASSNQYYVLNWDIDGNSATIVVVAGIR